MQWYSTGRAIEYFWLKSDKRIIIIYRNYSSIKLNINKVLKLKNYLKKKGHKFLLSTNIKLAIKLG